MSGKSSLYKTCSGKPKAPICPYCGLTSIFLASSAELYGDRDFGPAWACKPCGAWVGCHPGRQIALGRLANKELRQAKVAAHNAFDQLWQRKYRICVRERGPGYKKGYARRSGYHWLAEQLGIEFKDCHIGMFDLEQCRRVIEICRPYLRNAA